MKIEGIQAISVLNGQNPPIWKLKINWCSIDFMCYYLEDCVNKCLCIYFLLCPLQLNTAVTQVAFDASKTTVQGTFYNYLKHQTIQKYWGAKQQTPWVIAPGGFVSPPGGSASLLFDQAVSQNSQPHLADWNAICNLHRSDCAWLCCLLSQFLYPLVDIAASNIQNYCPLGIGGDVKGSYSKFVHWLSVISDNSHLVLSNSISTTHN